MGGSFKGEGFKVLLWYNCTASAVILSLEVAFTLLPTMPSLILDILSTKICTLHVKLWVKRTDMAQF